jgi:hypothetical protein
VVPIVQADPARGVARGVDHRKIVIASGEGFPTYKVLHARGVHPALEHDRFRPYGRTFAYHRGIVTVSEQRSLKVPGQRGRVADVIEVPVREDNGLHPAVTDDLPDLVERPGVVLPGAGVHDQRPWSCDDENIAVITGPWHHVDGHSSKRRFKGYLVFPRNENYWRTDHR